MGYNLYIVWRHWWDKNVPKMKEVMDDAERVEGYRKCVTKLYSVLTSKHAMKDLPTYADARKSFLSILDDYVEQVCATKHLLKFIDISDHSLLTIHRLQLMFSTNTKMFVLIQMVHCITLHNHLFLQMVD